MTTPPPVATPGDRVFAESSASVRCMTERPPKPADDDAARRDNDEYEEHEHEEFREAAEQAERAEHEADS
jgi:hypothetical protein